MRIVVASSNIGRNGAIIYCRRIIPLLAARGHDVWLAASPDSWIAKETAGEVPLVATDFRRWPGDELRLMAEFCRRERIDVFHSHLTRASNFGALLQLVHGVTSVAHLHSDAIRVHAWVHTLCIAVSQATLSCHRSRLAAIGRRGTVLMNFVDPDEFRPSTGPDLLRPLLGVSGATPVLLVVGDICRRKGQDLAARALPLVRRAYPDAVLALIGPGRLPDGLPRDGVHELGPRDDVASLLPHASIVLIPSRNEPSSLVAFEAMACGVPVIASAAGGVAETVADGGGRIVPRENIAALATETERLLADPAARERQAAAGLSRVLRDFTPGTHVESLERLYERAIATRRSPPRAAAISTARGGSRS